MLLHVPLPINGYTYDLRTIEAAVDTLIVDISIDIEEATTFNMRSTDENLNMEVANTITDMLYVQVIVDNLMYLTQYCIGSFYNSKDVLLKVPNHNPLHEDFQFPADIDRMIVYNWVELARKQFTIAYNMVDQFRERWQDLKKKVESTATELKTLKVGSKANTVPEATQREAD
ncbi:hypothetical protein BdWA1_000717 [Babesia duncani]|uniref:Uncharacterized protein n=1 Tax=Babesia duncani TaxID=323732 RepID=A0AAD9PMP5_9APIC|nr:hypothetical protein BdWA1_000717 [Babesia duncani]